MVDKTEKLDIPKSPGSSSEEPSNAFSEAYKTMSMPQILKEAKALLHAAGQEAQSLDFGNSNQLYAEKPGGNAGRHKEMPVPNQTEQGQPDINFKAIHQFHPVKGGDRTASNTIQSDGSEQLYKIHPGDTLTSIARRHLGPGASNQEIQKHILEIAKENHISNPNLIIAGRPLYLPERHHDAGGEQQGGRGQGRKPNQEEGEGGSKKQDNGKQEGKDDTPPKKDEPGKRDDKQETPPKKEEPGKREEVQPPPGGKVESTADGGTKVTDAKGNSVTSWPGGVEKHENTDGTGFVRKPDGQGGFTEHHWGKLPRDNFEVKDVGSERKRLSDLAEQRFKDHPDELKAFQENMRKFEERAKKDGLPPEEVAKTYKEVSRLLDAKGETPISSEERSAIAGQVMRQAAVPTSVDQGYHNTCNVATVECRTYTKTPSEAARLVTDVATIGQFTAYDGTVVKVDPHPHDSSKDRVTPDGARSHASEIFQVTAVNLHLEKENAKTHWYWPFPGKDKYEQHDSKPGTKDTGERLLDYSSDPPKEKGRAPGLSDGTLTEISNAITGKQESELVITHKNWTCGSYDGCKAVNSEEDLNKALADAKKEGKFPIVLRVNTVVEPFYTDSGSGAAGGSGGAHVVTVTDYEPGPPAKVAVDNQWGSSSDHTARGREIPVHEIYRAMQDTGSDANQLRKDVESNRANNTVDSSKEFELLRLEKLSGQINEKQYTDQLAQLVRDTQERWNKQAKDGTLNQDEVRNGKKALDAAIANLTPEDKFKVRSAENQVGMITDQEFNHEMALSIWRTKYEKDEKEAKGNYSDDDKKKYQDDMDLLIKQLQTFPLERRTKILEEVRGWQTYEQMHPKK